MSLSNQALFNLSRTGSTHIKVQSMHTPTGSTMTNYEEYLKSNHWQELKAKSAVLWGNKCLVCKCEMHVERHHIFYRDNLYDGKPSEIIPLCGECHEAAHVNDSNKNGQPKDKEAMKRLIDRLFYQIVRVRELPTEKIRLSHDAFWKTFTYCVNGNIPKKWNTFSKVPKYKKSKSKGNKHSRRAKRADFRKRQKESVSKTPNTIDYSLKSPKHGKRSKGQQHFSTLGHGINASNRYGYRAVRRWASIS